MSHVLVLGGVSYDLVVDLAELPAPTPQTLFARAAHESVGSTGAGKALNLARLGCDVTLHTLLGADSAADQVRAALDQPGLTLLTARDPAGTERHVNLMDPDGRRISIFLAAASPDLPLDPAAIAPALATADVVALNIIPYCRRFIPLLQAAGRPIWCDIHDYDGVNPYHAPFIAAAAVLFCSSDALPDYRAFLAAMLAAGKRLVVCTHGPAGATAATPDGAWVDVPALPVRPVVDANGAGDSLFAGYLYGHLRGWPPLVCLRLGTLVAARCLTTAELADPTLTPAALHAAYAAHYGPLPAP